MNLSKAITSIITQLGLYNVTLPFKDKDTGAIVPVENTIRNVLVDVTIPMYSQFVPWMREGTININQLKCVDPREGIYMLPAFLTLTPILYVSDVHLPFHNNRGTFGDIAPAYGINRSTQGVATSMAYMMTAGQMRSEPSWEDIGYNKIKLYGWPKTNIVIKVAAQHESNGESIEESCYDSFMELAILDVKIFLYNNLKYYNNIPTAFGQIELKIDDFQSADSDRNTLLDRWRDSYHVDMGWEEWM